MHLNANTCMRGARRLIALALFGLAPAGAAPELIDRIAAVVDDEIILWSELNYRLQVALQESGYRALPPPAELDSLRQQILTSMVDEQVLILKAEKDSVVVDESAVQEETEMRFNGVKESFPKGEFGLMLERSGLTERELRARLRKQVRAGKLFERMQQDVYWSTHVTHKDVEAYRQAHSEVQPPILSLSQITITVKPDTAALAAVQQKITAVQKRLAAGEDFATLARAQSEDPGTKDAGGSLGCFGPGLLVPEFENAANLLKPGEISQPVLTQFGYHLIRLDEKRESELCASHILIRAATSGQDRERVHRTLTELRQRAIDGADFAALARVHSEGALASRGGLMGNIPKDALPFYLQSHIGYLKLGEISQPFFLEDIGHLVKINDDQTTLENLIREDRTADTMQKLIDGHKTEIHLDTRLRDDAESPLGYVAP